MKAHDFRFIRDTLGLKNPELAVLLGVTARSVGRYSDDSRPIPGPVERLMWLLNDGKIKPHDILAAGQIATRGQQ